jgi:hypothetical protein
MAPVQPSASRPSRRLPTRCANKSRSAQLIASLYRMLCHLEPLGHSSISRRYPGHVTKASPTHGSGKASQHHNQHPHLRLAWTAVNRPGGAGSSRRTGLMGPRGSTGSRAWSKTTSITTGYCSPTCRRRAKIDKDREEVLATSATDLAQAFEAFLSPVDAAALNEEMAEYLTYYEHEGLRQPGMVGRRLRPRPLLGIPAGRHLRPRPAPARQAGQVRSLRAWPMARHTYSRGRSPAPR